MTAADSKRNAILAIAASWVTLAAVFTAQEYAGARYLDRPVRLARVILGVAPHYILWAILAIGVAAMSRRFPLERGHLATRIPLHIAASLVFYAIDVAVSSLVVPPLLSRPAITPFLFGLAAIRSFYDDFLLYWGIAGVTHLIRGQRKLREEELRRSELQRAFTSAQLDALRAQLQPHFLFNTLNSIAELMHVDIVAAERMIEALSTLLRCSLDAGEHPEITLADELRMLDVYLEIQQVRFHDSVVIEREIDPAAFDALVPTLLLQPIVENAFRHGIPRRRDRGIVVIRAQRDGARIRIEVRDNGAGPPKGWREGIGLGTTRERLEWMYGEDQSLTLSAVDGGGTRVEVALPYRSVEAE